MEKYFMQLIYITATIYNMEHANEGEVETLKPETGSHNQASLLWAH